MLGQLLNFFRSTVSSSMRSIVPPHRYTGTVSINGRVQINMSPPGCKADALGEFFLMDTPSGAMSTYCTQILASEGILGEMADSRPRAGKV